MTDDVAPEGRSVSSPEAAGRSDSLTREIRPVDRQVFFEAIERIEDRLSKLEGVSVMILCPECGNKRCPKAMDANWKCTGSNEVGQIPVFDQAARNASEDTQRSDSEATTDDVDALVEAGQRAVEVMNSDGRICRDKASKTLRAALQPFQKG